MILKPAGLQEHFTLKEERSPEGWGGGFEFAEGKEKNLVKKKVVPRKQGKNPGICS